MTGQERAASGVHRCAVGVDVGGTKVRAALVDGRGLVGAGLQESTRAAAGVGVDQAVDLALRLVDAHGEQTEIVGVGVGLPEVISPGGRVGSAAVVDWRGEDLPERFAAIGPLVVDADVRCGALAESRLGAGRGASSLLYLSIGTGISASLVIGGHPWRGARGSAGLTGSAPLTVLDDAHRLQRCPPLEEVAAGPSIAGRYAYLSGLRSASAEEVVSAADRGEALAVEVLTTAGSAVGAHLGLLVAAFDPTVAVVGGGLGSAPGPFWEALRSSVGGHVWAPVTSEVPVSQATFGGDAGVIGAGLAALNAYSSGKRTGNAES